MAERSDVAPQPIDVELDPGGIYLTYLDGRRVFYNGIPEAVESSVRCRPGKEVQVLITDESETEGILTYVNERKTGDDILEDTGVGRIMIDSDEEAVIFDGVRALLDGLIVEVHVDFTAVEGRVFVFEEDELGEAMYEIVPA